MSFVWLVTLLIYGLVNGFAHVDALSWWLLLPMFIQDLADSNSKKNK